MPSSHTTRPTREDARKHDYAPYDSSPAERDADVKANIAVQDDLIKVSKYAESKCGVLDFAFEFI